MSMFLKTEDPLHMVTVGEEGFYGLESGRESENPDQVSSALFGGLQQEEFLRIYNLTTDMANWATRSGQDFVRNHDMESIDYCAVHLWPDNWGGLPIAFQSRWIEAHAIDSAALGKPMTIEEFGKISGASDQEIKDVRDPYIRDVCNTFDQLKTTYPLGGNLCTTKRIFELSGISQGLRFGNLMPSIWIVQMHTRSIQHTVPLKKSSFLPVRRSMKRLQLCLWSKTACREMSDRLMLFLWKAQLTSLLESICLPKIKAVTSLMNL